MKIARSILSCLLCACIMCGLVCFAFAEGSGARLYNVYGNHMLFQQNADAVFAGEAASGTKLTVKLKDQAGKTVESASGTASLDGTFSLSLPAPAGSFEAYTVILTADGSKFCTLKDVVFGELWLSFGQSNMEYSLSITPEGREMQQSGTTGSEALRVLQISHPVKDGALFADAAPQTDAQNCHWYTGDRTDVYSMSAVAYFFAEKIIEKLKMPVGILNAAVGGSAIAAWLPRQAIEADESVLSAMKAHNNYLSTNDWNNGKRNYLLDMSGLFNSKIAPLKNFRPAGSIWYQGETDFMFYDDPAFYAQMFDLMQNSYSSLFSLENRRLPIVFTQLVSYDYNKGPYAETRFNDVFTSLAAVDPATRSEVVISDLSPAYYEDCGAIHPMTKKPIGERMANCAEGLIYDGAMPTSSPAKTAMKVQGQDVLVTFSNTGDGLVCSGKELRGFSVYGADGVCLSAEAEIVSADTVRVHCDEITDPAGAAYAVNSLSPGANLWSIFQGEPYLPAASFGAYDPSIKKHFDDADWLRCDTLTAWQNSSGDPGVQNIWTASGSDLAVCDDAAEGSGSLFVKANSPCFSVIAPFSKRKNLEQKIHDNLDTDLSQYGTLTVRLKNNGKHALTLKQLQLFTDTSLWFAPLCLQSKMNCAVIPADGAWHTYSFDLNKLGFFGGAVDRWSNEALKSVISLRLCFFGSGAALQIDGFRFTAEAQSGENSAAFLQQLVLRIAAFLEKIGTMLHIR